MQVFRYFITKQTVLR